MPVRFFGTKDFQKLVANRPKKIYIELVKSHERKKQKTKSKIDRDYQTYLGNLVSCQALKQEETTRKVHHLPRNNF